MSEKLGRSVVGGLCVRGASAVLAFLLTAVLARILGSEGYGIYAYSLSLATLLAVPAHMGLPTLIVREIAVAHEKREWGRMRGVLIWGNRMAFIAGSTLALTAAIISYAVFGGIANPNFQTQFWAFTLVPLLALAGVRAGALRGLNRIVHGQLSDRVIRPVTLLLLLAIAWFTCGVRPETAMMLHALAAGIAFVTSYMMLKRVFPLEARRAAPRLDTDRWLRGLIPLAFLSGIQVINNQTDIVMLGILANPEQVGIYSAVFQVSILVSFMLTVVNLAIAPHFARLYAARQKQQLQRAATWAARLSLGIALPVALGLFAFGDLLLRVIFGEEYMEGYTALVLLAIGQTVNAATGSVILLLNMTGHERDTMKGVAIAAIANVTLNLILIPKMGVNGAALATTASIVLWNILLSIFVYHRIHIISVPVSFRTGTNNSNE
jgi:O-antigen/teichoic acid export membrane protein